MSLEQFFGFVVKVVADAVSVNAGRAQIEFRMDLGGVFLHAFFIMIFGSILVDKSSVDFWYFLTKMMSSSS